MSQRKTMTFSDVLSRKRERRTSTFSSDSSGQAPFFSLDYLEGLMTSAIDLLANDSVKSLKGLEISFMHIPHIYSKAVFTWHDEYGLNVIHYSIIYNKPTCLDFFLSKTELFPPDTEPTICPYAHLAAFLGHTECLQIVLTLRPKDFFKAKLPKHAIKIPNAIMRRFKTNEQRSSRHTRTIKSLLSNIPSQETENEDMERSDETSHVVKGLEDDVYGLEKYFQKNPPRPENNALPNGKHNTIQGKNSNQNTDTLHPKMRTSESSPSFKTCQLNITTTAPKSHKKELSNSKKKDKITVYRDIFAEYPDGEPDRMSMIYSMEEKGGKSESHKSSSRADETKKAKPSTHRSSSSKRHSNSDTPDQPALGSFELGVRKVATLKKFSLNIEKRVIKEKDPSQSYMNKTPLTLAAERGHLECIELMLDLVVSKRAKSNSAKTEPLTLATKARSVEALLVLLTTKKYDIEDYHGAVLTAIRSLFPDCLVALLNSKDQNRSQNLFQGANLFHILFSQSLVADYRYEMLPKMTKTLITCKESVNAQACPRTYPLYTLIDCAFHAGIGKKMSYYLGCLEILLSASANPHYNEINSENGLKNDQTLVQRSGYTSAINCIFENASQALARDVKMYWLKLLLKKIITTIVFKDRTRRRVLDDVLFQYMNHVCDFDFDRIILKTLLRYGGNPDATLDGIYAVNAYFDKLLPYLTRFEVINSYQTYQNDLQTLMILCRRMSSACLREAFGIFMDAHFLKTPLQGLPITRYFCFLINDLLQSPRSLQNLVSNYLWTHLNRNEKLVYKLPVRGDIISSILP